MGKKLKPQRSLICPYCKRVFQTTNSRKIYCSSKCSIDQWNEDHPERVRAYARKYREANIERIHARDNAPSNRVRRRISTRAWQKRTRAARREYERRRRLTDPQFLILLRLRAIFRGALRRGHHDKKGSLKTLVGCSLAKLKVHIERQFLPGMSWVNRDKWQIDHIRPVASFDLTDYEQQRICFHYMNLRPLWKKKNSQKGAYWNRQLALNWAGNETAEEGIRNLN